MRPVNLIVIHCSASPDGVSLARFSPGAGLALTAAKVIDGWHAARGFKRSVLAAARFNPHLPHLGYHYVIDVDGAVQTGRGLNEIGAHAAGFNAESVGICLVGTARYTRAQWQTLGDLIVGTTSPFERSAASFIGAPLTRMFGIGLRSPWREWQHATRTWRVRDGICGHRDLSPDQNTNGIVEPFEWLKTCPGFSVAEWLRSNLVPPPFAVLDPLHATTDAAGAAHA